MRHEKGQPEYMDQNITIGQCCLTQDEAIEVCKKLNESKYRNKYKYYVRMV